jgi:hypothetical protein
MTSSVKKLLALNYLICLIGFIAELIFAFHFRTNENSIFIFLIFWGTLPIVTLLLFLFRTPRIPYFMRLLLVQTSAVVGIGLAFKINSIYIHPDPRGALALTSIPIVQIIGTLFVGIINRFIIRKHLLNQISANESEDEVE